MNTAIRTSLLCDTVPFPESSRFRKGTISALVDAPIATRPAEGTLGIARESGSPGVQLGAYTVFGTQVSTSMRDGQPVVSFHLNCSRGHRLHFPASQVTASRIVGRCGGHDLVELTIAFRTPPH